MRVSGDKQTVDPFPPQFREIKGGSTDPPPESPLRNAGLTQSTSRASKKTKIESLFCRFYIVKAHFEVPKPQIFRLRRAFPL